MGKWAQNRRRGSGQQFTLPTVILSRTAHDDLQWFFVGPDPDHWELYGGATASGSWVLTDTLDGSDRTATASISEPFYYIIGLDVSGAAVTTASNTVANP
jgi:hypothetical protein